MLRRRVALRRPARRPAADQEVRPTTKSKWGPVFSTALFLSAALLFADPKEQPVGLVLSPNGSKLLRADTETPLEARSGDLLFTGDGLRTDAGSASFLFCPAKAIETLGPSGEVRFDAT